MTHRASQVQVDLSKYKQHSITWPEDVLSVDEWIKQQPVTEWKQFFDQNGYLKVDNLLSDKEVAIYQDLYQQMLDGRIDTSSHRHDLGNHIDQAVKGVENICQIMWPSLYVDGLEPQTSPLHGRALAVSKVILGEDMAFDFDMLIYKHPFTPAETPWHQDQGYWPDMPDKRAVSCWVAVDKATVENGCMWFVPGSHKKGIRKHRPVAEGKHVLTCDVDSTECIAVPLPPGSCTFHHGGTAHHTGRNNTDTHRRAYIMNARPADMVEYERNRGYDHGQVGMHEMVGKSKSHVQV